MEIHDFSSQQILTFVNWECFPFLIASLFVWLWRGCQVWLQKCVHKFTLHAFRVLTQVPINAPFNASQICLNNVIEMTLQETDSHSKWWLNCLWLLERPTVIPFKVTVLGCLNLCFGEKGDVLLYIQKFCCGSINFGKSVGFLSQCLHWERSFFMGFMF